MINKETSNAEENENKRETNEKETKDNSKSNAEQNDTEWRRNIKRQRRIGQQFRHAFRLMSNKDNSYTSIIAQNSIIASILSKKLPKMPFSFHRFLDSVNSAIVLNLYGLGVSLRKAFPTAHIPEYPLADNLRVCI